MPQDTQSAAFLLGKTTPGMPAYQPPVQPSLQGATSLQGTMTQQPQGVSTQPLPQPTMNLGLFGRAMDEMRGKLGQNQELVDQKNKLLTLVYDRQLSPEETAKLTPSQQRAVESGNMGLIQGQVRIINDTLKGRTQSIDKSISYLTDLYEKDIENAERQKQQATDTILQYAQALGQKPSIVAEALGYDANLGLKLDKLMPPITGGGSGGGFGGSSGVGSTSPIAQAVIDGVIRLEDLTPTVRGQIAPQLAAAGFKTGPKLSSGQQDDIASMDVLGQQLADVEGYFGGGLEGVGGFGLGSLKQAISKNLGISSEEGNQVRAIIGNIKGTIAKLRGGTSFTPNEEKLLETYTPGINESASSIASKITALKTFMNAKRNALLKAAQERSVQGTILEGTTPSGIKFKVTN